MANGGSRRGLYGEGRRTAVAAETHSPPHVQGASLARLIEGSESDKWKSGSEAKVEVETKKNKKVSKVENYIFRYVNPEPRQKLPGRRQGRPRHSKH